MNLIFSAGSVEECLVKASRELNINKEQLQYKVIKEERKFFKKKITIEITHVEDKKNDEITRENSEQYKKNSGASVRDGKIYVKNSENENDIITIKPCDKVDLFLNGEKTDFIEKALESDQIEYKIQQEEPDRNIEISISNDKMEAYITVTSIPKVIYELEDNEFCENLVLKKHKLKEVYAPRYTRDEIITALKEKNITSGIIEEKINDVCSKDESKNILIVKGVQAIDDVPERIEILFKDSDKLEENSDTSKKIDYRNRFSLATVKSGDEIAKIIPSVRGKNGKDIFGTEVKRKESSAAKFKTGDGCKYEGDKIIATVEGKPSYKSNTFKVHQLYKVDEVNLSTGNINFVADVEVVKTVDEGMEVVSGNTILIGGNVESAKVCAASDITIRGNLLNSTVIAGEKNIYKKKYLLDIKEIITVISDLYSAVVQVSQSGLFGNKKTGELIKILIENKYKTLIPTCKEIIRECDFQGITHSPITVFINEKIIGFGPLTIQDESELENFKELLQEEADELEQFEADEANVFIEYMQGSKVEAIGSVFIKGKGQYTSNITALNNIEFLQSNAVCRGGMLSAGKEIRLKVVGSEAGVNTVLKVPKDGVITADIAYNNTTFCFGEKQRVLDVSSKNVKAYIDAMGDITIDKLLL